MPMMIAITLPSLARARALAKRTSSAANLHGIANAMFTYSGQHNGQFPPKLRTLLDDKLITPGALKSPLEETNREISYVYIPGQTADDPPENVLAYEYPENSYNEGTNVLFVDGHVSFMSMPEFEKVLATTKERLSRSGRTETGQKE